MVDPNAYWSSLPTIPQVMMDWLKDKGVHPLTIGSGQNAPIKVARGYCADDGWFDVDPSGDPHFGILVEDRGGPVDVAFWHPRSGRVATLLHYGFAFGEEQIDNTGLYSFEGYLRIHANPLDWLRADRDGIFVLDWSRAFDRLRYCPRIAVPTCILNVYQQAMKPQEMPELFVLAEDRSAAA